MALADIALEVHKKVYPERYVADEAIAHAFELREALDSADHNEAVESAIMDYIQRLEPALGVQTTSKMWATAISGEVTVSAAVERWLNAIEDSVTRGTIDKRQKAVRQFISDMGDISISAITPRVTTNWLYDHLKPSGRAAATIKEYIGSMSLLWDWSRRREWCEGVSPFEGLSREVKVDSKKKRAYTDEELKLFLDALVAKQAKDPVEFDVGIMLVESATRLNEICELRVKDIVLHADCVEARIRSGKTKSAGRCLFFFSERVRSVVERRLVGKATDDQLFEELMPGGQDQKLGHSLSKRMRSTLSKVIPDAKEKGIDLHSIRRWGGTIIDNLPEQDGIDRTLKKRAFGHASGDMLGDVYSDGPEKDRVKTIFKAFANRVSERIYSASDE